jgi:DNA-binding response OmpR family regulator
MPIPDYPEARVLVVDDHPGMRTSIRMTLSAFGVTHTDLALDAADAVRRIRARPYDILICDYNLGDGRSGQQLLEELRHARMIPMTTMFVMVTAERSYEKVAAVAELAPDDYLIKPFTAESLRLRLDRVRAKKTALAPIYEWLETGELERALSACDVQIEARSRYTLDALRIKAEILVARGDFDAAQQVYEQVLALRALPWARLGLARALHYKDKHAEAEQLLELTIAHAPEFMAAHDLLAEVKVSLDKRDEAQAVLLRAAEASPLTLRRQRALGEMALANDDLETATRALENVVKRGRNSALRAPGDYGLLAHVYADQGRAKEALALTREARDSFGNSPEARLAAAIAEAHIHAKLGDGEAAKRAVDEALELQSGHAAHLTEQQRLDLAQACLGHGREDAGRAIVSRMIADNHESESLIARTRAMFDKLGRGDEGHALVEKSRQEVVALNNEGVLLARSGDLAGAAKLLAQAAERLPNNLQIVLNAAQARLALIERTGMDEAGFEQARGFLAQARAKEPNHAKLLKVAALARRVAAKYGVQYR